MYLTRHAAAQMQQRGISTEMLVHLLTWGRKAYDHRGATIHYFDKAARQRLARHIGSTIKDLKHQFNAYLVIAPDGGVITVGHRYKRIARQ